MLNEYGIVLIEILIAFISGLMSIGFIRKRNDCILTWKEFGYRFITFLVLLVITFIYMIEYQKNQSILLLVCTFIGVIIAFLGVFFLLLILMNWIFSLFKVRKYTRIHIILNFVDTLKTLNMNRLSQLNTIVESCFLFACLFSLGSMVVAFVIYFFLLEMTTTEIYILNIGPSLILWFVVLAGGLWILSLFITLIYHERIKEGMDDISRIQLRKKVQEEKNKW